MNEIDEAEKKELLTWRPKAREGSPRRLYPLRILDVVVYNAIVQGRTFREISDEIGGGLNSESIRRIENKVERRRKWLREEKRGL
jgi:hypothetical protein